MLVNESLAGLKVATPFGQIEFNDKGESKDLKEADEKAIAKLPGYQHVAPKKEAPKKEAPKKEEIPKKAPAKKAPAKKQAAKPEEK
jgi:hypothetical protein